jgi:hypothetical protein
MESEVRGCRRVIRAVLAGLFVVMILHAWAQEDGMTGLENLKSLTGAEFKLLDVPIGTHGFRLGISAGVFFPLKPGEDAFGQHVNDSIAARIYSDPELFIRLTEQLGGEFILGNHEGSSGTENIRLQPNAGLRIAGGVSVTDRFLINLEYAYHRHRLTGDFPVTVFPEEPGQPYTYFGHISSDIGFHEVAITGSFFFSQTRLQPFGGISLIWQWQKEGPVQATIGDESFTLDETDNVSGFPGIAVFSGAEYRLSGHFALLLKIQYQQIFDDKYGIEGSGFSASLGCAWMFGQ